MHAGALAVRQGTLSPPYPLEAGSPQALQSPCFSLQVSPGLASCISPGGRLHLSPDSLGQEPADLTEARKTSLVSRPPELEGSGWETSAVTVLRSSILLLSWEMCMWARGTPKVNCIPRTRSSRKGSDEANLALATCLSLGLLGQWGESTFPFVLDLVSLNKVGGSSAADRGEIAWLSSVSFFGK